MNYDEIECRIWNLKKDNNFFSQIHFEMNCIKKDSEDLDIFAVLKNSKESSDRRKNSEEKLCTTSYTLL